LGYFGGILGAMFSEQPMNFELIKSRFDEKYSELLKEAKLQDLKGKNEKIDIEAVEKFIKETFKVDLFKNFSDLRLQIREFIDESQFLNKEELRLKLQKLAHVFERLFSLQNAEISYFFNNLFAFVNADFRNVYKDFFYMLNLSNLQVLSVLDILIDFQEIMDAPLKHFKEKKEAISKNFQGNLLSVQHEILKKVKEGAITTADLFRLSDMDGNGFIGMEEFKILAKRLGMPLTEHRTNEIFTSVLEKDSQNQIEMKLNEKDFEIAFNYLQSQSISLTLEYLGINSEILTLILIWLIILLLIIFAFIFVGIQAFALGGSFGAVINSLFPIGFFCF
jgi:hypothetical protein